ncbi:MAG: di-trans,poly-cis-decaprenylcistransferase [Firmicutes bacterium]|nr:di-trans,poly-cis-decaprenylcistransferase [Bacillota bacterium]
MGEKKPMPVHVAVIMDGNGRWAEMKGVPKLLGHNQGTIAMENIVRKADDMGIRYLTVYAFSTENWKRSSEEVGGIFRLLVKFVKTELRELKERNVKVNILGDWHDRIPEDAVASIRETLESTQKNTGLVFNIALNYGSRAEIVRGVNKLLSERDRGEQITEEDISASLFTGDENGNIPDPDLIIRTSGEERLSNFLLWQAAYSEFAFTDTLWPDFMPEEFESIIEEYRTRERRYGGRL